MRILKDDIKQHLSEQMNMDIDIDDIDIDILDPHSFLRNFQEKMQEDPEFQELLEKNAKMQKEKKQELKNISQATKKIYISLITEFHPDKETDELKKLEKTEIVKKITLAYEEDDLFELLYDEQQAPDDQLPDTGLDLQRERALSSMFIKSPGYGSRCSTVVLLEHQNKVEFYERVFNLETFEYKTEKFEFTITS